MKFRCIHCSATWGEGDPEQEGYSDGLCGPCLKLALIPLYRRRQAQEGNCDCFAKSGGCCDQSTCKYREICLS